MKKALYLRKMKFLYINMLYIVKDIVIYDYDIALTYVSLTSEKDILLSLAIVIFQKKLTEFIASFA